MQLQALRVAPVLGPYETNTHQLQGGEDNFQYTHLLNSCIFPHIYPIGHF